MLLGSRTALHAVDMSLADKKGLWWWEIKQTEKGLEGSEDTEEPVDEPGEIDLHRVAGFRAVVLPDSLADTGYTRSLEHSEEENQHLNLS